jgi:hypothetical protein
MRKLLVAALGALVFAGTAVADPLDPKVKLNPIDGAYASRALVSRADLGSAWVGNKINPPSSLKAPVCPSLRPDFSKLTITGHAESVYNNGNGGIQIISDAEVWKTKQQMRTHFQKLFKPKLPECLAYSLRKMGIDAGSIGPVAELPFPDMATVAVHFRAPIKVGKLIVYADFIWLGKGRTQVYINVIAPSNVGSQLTALEQRIARAVLKRIKA